MNTRSLALAAAMLLATLITPASAETFAIVGTGNVGSALGQRFAELGHTVIYGSRDPSRESVARLVEATGEGARAMTPAAAAELADVVVLAVPWQATETTVRSLGNLTGKIVIDPSNPRDENPDGLLDYPLSESNAELIQRIAPDAHVVKAFNLMAARVMRDPDVDEGVEYWVPVAGDDDAAKSFVIELIRTMGLKVTDFGKIRHAHTIEALYSSLWNMRRQGFDLTLQFQDYPTDTPRNSSQFVPE